MFLENTDCAWWQRCDFYLHVTFQWVCVLLLLGATLHEAILQTLHEWGLALPRLISCSTDGAGAMLGHRSGFHARVKADNQYAINVLFSRWADYSWFVWFSWLSQYTFKDSFRQLYDYHDNSAKRSVAGCGISDGSWLFSQAERAQHYALVLHESGSSMSLWGVAFLDCGVA